MKRKEIEEILGIEGERERERERDMEEVLKGMGGVSNGSSWKKGEGEISEEKREGRRNGGILRERERERKEKV